MHEDGFQVGFSADGEPEFRRPDGRPLSEAPPAIRDQAGGPDPFEALLQRLEDGAVSIGPYTGTPTWDGERVELGLAVEWYLAKIERAKAAAHNENARTLPPDG